MACPYLTPLPLAAQKQLEAASFEAIAKYNAVVRQKEGYSPILDEPSPPLTAENFYDNIEEVE